MTEHRKDYPLYVSPDATDHTGKHLFDGAGYGFDYLPPFSLRRPGVDGDLVVEDASGARMAVSPQFVVPEAPLEDPVRHPSHYKGKGGMEAIDVIEAFDLNYRLGNSAKYLLRAGKKGDEVDAITDLRKAVVYIEREIAKREEAL